MLLGGVSLFKMSDKVPQFLDLYPPSVKSFKIDSDIDNINRV